MLLAVAGSLSWVARATSVTSDSYSPAGRIMLVVVAVGMVVLWPMTRLSQASPRRPLGAVWNDLMLIELPIQIVTWPMMVLGSWPPDIVLAVSALLGGWGLLTAGLIAAALSGSRVDQPGDRRLIARTVWMVGAVLLLAAAPLAQGIVVFQGHEPPAWLRMGSPVTAIAALTGRGLMGPPAPASVVQWQCIAMVWLAGVVLWAVALAKRYGRSSRGSTGPGLA